MALLPQELIRFKRDGTQLTPAQIQTFVQGVTDGSWSEGQVAAMAMAILLRGMDTAETVALTAAMAHSGQTLTWPKTDMPGPVLDKHSTGGVGDKVSLMLAPMLAACGAFVPMISGRGLGHTGGTLDKLESLPGYQGTPDLNTLSGVVRSTGCAIVGATDQLAPADRRLYGIRDVTATVESVPLITASILSKKLAAGLAGLVMDVKSGNGAVSPSLEEARALARSLVQVAKGSGLPTVALITDMNQVLGVTAGNALEVREAIDFLTGRQRDSRLLEVTLSLCAHALVLGGLSHTLSEAKSTAQRALDSGAAADRFGRMVAALGGPADVLKDAQLPIAPVQYAVRAPRAGVISALDARAAGWAVVALGGGRRRADDRIDPRVGVSEVIPLQSPVEVGDTLAIIHAAKLGDAEQAAQAWLQAVSISSAAGSPTSVVLEVIE